MSARLKRLRLIFWSCLAITTATPALGVLYSLFGHEMRPTAQAAALIAFLVQCICCAQLVDEQPDLARSGMLWLGIFLILLIVTGVLLGPISG